MKEFFTLFPTFPAVHFPSDEHLEEHSDFLVIPRHQELLGDQAKECDIHISMEKTSLEDGRHYLLSYVLFRCLFFPPGFFSFFLILSRQFVLGERRVSSLCPEGDSLQSSSRAAVWTRLSCTRCSSTRCSQVSITL